MHSHNHSGLVTPNVRLSVATEITYNRRRAKQNEFRQIDNIDINNDRSLLCQHINIANHS